MDMLDDNSRPPVLDYDPARVVQFMLASSVSQAVREQFLREVLRAGDNTVPGKPWWVGKRLSIKDHNCTIRFVGKVEGTGKEWIGVEWDNPTNGKHDGSYNGRRYFHCLSSSPIAASFVRSLKERDINTGVDFLHAVVAKYAPAPEQHDIVEISGKVVQEIGFDKISEMQSRLHELKYLVVDGEKIRRADPSLQPFPEVLELDLSRNLFESFLEVSKICQALQNLRRLAIDGNRFQDLSFMNFPTGFDGQKTSGFGNIFQKIKELSMDETLLPWESIVWVRNLCPFLEKLSVSSNSLNDLPCLLPDLHLRSLVMEYNNFPSLASLTPLRHIRSLENLSLKGNKISSIDTQNSPLIPFPTNLSYVDLSYNLIDSWSFVDSLSIVFPGLTKLRLSGNPLYPSSSEISKSDSDYLFMVTLARVSTLQNLNFSPISKTERTNAEMFYLSLIAKEISSAPKEEEDQIIGRHKRYKELCELHGEPVVVRKQEGEINPNFLEARLISFEFVAKEGVIPDRRGEVVMKKEIPKSFDVYRVKGLVGRMFGVKPLSLKLVWETGEWDPVAGYEELEDSESENEGDEVERPEGQLEEKGKWMKREVELVDGTRQVGFCVDGLEARVRVELR